MLLLTPPPPPPPTFPRNFHVGLYSDIYRPISFKLGMMIETTKFYILISVWMTLTQGNCCIEIKKLLCPFSRTLQSIWMKFCRLPQPVGLLKLMLNLFCTEYSWEIALLAWFYKIYFLYRPVCEPICLKLGMRLHTTKLYSLIPVWLNVMLTQDHRLLGKLELVQALCGKAAWSNSNACDGWLCNGDDREEVL